MSELLYGIHPLSEALAAGRRSFKKIYVSKTRKGGGPAPLLNLARDRGVSIDYRDPAFFASRLGDVVHQGVAGEVGALPLVDADAIVRKARDEQALPLILALDEVVDPQNLGTLIRCGVALGVHGIIVPKARRAPFSPAVSKASAGAMEHALLAPVPNLVAALKQLKSSGLWIVGADAGAAMRVEEAAFDVGVVLVVGGEGKGIRPLVKKTCDYLVSIPQGEQVSSLNAAVAGAIVLYEIGRQRRMA